MTNCKALLTALNQRDNQPFSSWRALDELVQAQVGARLFTAMTFDARTDMASRVYTNNPNNYPTKGTKPIVHNTWTAHVIEGGRTFVANDIDAIAAVFNDYELIQSLGCESAVNVPVFAAGEMLGSINLLHQAGYYTPERVEAAEQLALAACTCFLFDRLVSGHSIHLSSGEKA